MLAMLAIRPLPGLDSDNHSQGDKPAFPYVTCVRRAAMSIRTRDPGLLTYPPVP